MRLSLKINGDSRLVAAVVGPGYLSAHLNMHHRPKENDYSKTVHVTGIQTLETETIHSNWPDSKLEVGDRVELTILDDEGTGDEPTEVRRSSEAPTNLFSTPELAQEVLGLVSDFETRLIELMDKSHKAEPEQEHKKFTKAVGYVIAELGDRLLYPIYRRHKQLIPNALKGELL